MTDRLDQDLDELLGRHMRERLDGQLGRAVAALRDELAPRWRWRLWASVGTAVAAGIAIALIVLSNHEPDKKNIVDKDKQPGSMVAEVPMPMLQSAVWSGIKDDGTTFVDDRPVRRLKRNIVEECEWYDAKSRATVRTTLPREQIFIIELKTD